LENVLCSQMIFYEQDSAIALVPHQRTLVHLCVRFVVNFDNQGGGHELWLQ
jgi:hypothetical protein